MGGVPYLVPGPAAWRERVYCFNQVASQVQLPGGHVLGACAGLKIIFKFFKSLKPRLKTRGGRQFRVYTEHCHLWWFE